MLRFSTLRFPEWRAMTLWKPYMLSCLTKEAMLECL